MGMILGRVVRSAQIATFYVINLKCLYLMVYSLINLPIRTNRLGVPILRLHYSAHPKKSPEWAAEGRRRTDSTLWAREEEIDWLAGGGELLLAPILRERADKILIDPAKSGWRPSPHWNYYGGFDWGQTNPSSFHLYAIDKQGVRYALMEHYLTGLTPAAHAPFMLKMRLVFGEDAESVPAFTLAQWVFSDPSIMYSTHAQANGSFRSLVSLFPPEISKKMVSGSNAAGLDGTFTQTLKQMWAEDDPKFKIVCPGGIPTQKKEGTFSDGCPNLVWEFMRVRRQETTGLQLMSKNPMEKIVQKDNHAIDDCKYFFFGGVTHTPQDTKEELWAKEKAEIIRRNPNLDINSMIILRSKFERKQAEIGSKSWR